MSNLKNTHKAWLIWLVLAVGICLHQIQTDHKRTVTYPYTAAATSWMAGQDMYGKGPGGFLYMPHAAIVFVPFAVLPQSVGEVAWRIVCIGIFALSIMKLTKASAQKRADDMFLLATVMTIPISFSAIRNGQMTLPMAATMMFAVVALTRLHYARAAFWLSLGVALKPLAIIMMIMAVALYPELLKRVVIGMVIVFLVPFLFQSPGYVFESYQLFIKKMAVAGDIRTSLSYSDVFGMLRAWDITISYVWMSIVRAIMGIGALLCAWYMKQKESNTISAVFLYSISITFLLLASPRTENSTYAAFAPVLSVFAGWAFYTSRNIASGCFFVGISIFVTVHFELARQITPGREIWISPLMTVMFVIYVFFSVLKGHRFWREAENT